MARGVGDDHLDVRLQDGSKHHAMQGLPVKIVCISSGHLPWAPFWSMIVRGIHGLHADAAVSSEWGKTACVWPEGTWRLHGLFEALDPSFISDAAHSLTTEFRSSM
jgi:hypothetical protein